VTPRFLRATALILAKDLRLEWRTWDTLSSTGVFALIVLVVFHFALDVGAVRDLPAAWIVPGVIWIALAFAAVVGFSRSLEGEREHETLGALFLTPVDRGAVWAGKALANLVKLTALEILLLPLTALFFDYDLVHAAPALSLVLLVHGVGLCELGTLFAAIATRLGRGEALLATLLLPAAVPLLISAVKCTAGALGDLEAGAQGSWMLLALGFDLLYFFVSLLTFEFVLEE
jgi:heme exporter protein B